MSDNLTPNERLFERLEVLVAHDPAALEFLRSERAKLGETQSRLAQAQETINAQAKTIAELTAKLATPRMAILDVPAYKSWWHSAPSRISPYMYDGDGLVKVAWANRGVILHGEEVAQVSGALVNMLVPVRFLKFIEDESEDAL